jgi:hypothetical protein
MGKTRSTVLDDHALQLLDGHDLEGKVGIALELVTVAEHGVPHAALLSAGEVLAFGRDRVRLALWPTSQTTANLRSRPSALLTFVAAGGFYGIELSVQRYDGAELPELAFFDADVAAVDRDEVPYAQVTTGVSFTLPEADAVLQRWARTVAALREVPDRAPGAGQQDP